MEEVKIIIWVFIVIFSITAIITLLGITGVIKSIKPNHLNILFTSLILEVVAAVIVVFQGVDFSQQEMTLSHFFTEMKIEAPQENDEQRKSYLVSQINAATTLPGLEQQLQTLEQQQLALQSQLDTCQGDVSQLNFDFFTKVTRLRNLITTFRGGKSINLEFEPDKKTHVYELLKDVLGILQLLQIKSEQQDVRQTEVQIQIRDAYLRFKKNHGRDSVLTYHFLEYDAALMMRDYLNLYYSD